jgi:hypothetical protein
MDELISASLANLTKEQIGPASLSQVRKEIGRARDVAEEKPAKAERPRRTTRQPAHASGSNVLCRCAPKAEPEWWNDQGLKQFNNNCYNYGTNYRTDTFAQPGRGSGFPFTNLSCGVVKIGALRDGLVDASQIGNQCPPEGHLVALVVAPRFDFHWYRKTRDGLWTHKIGPEPVTPFDNAGRLILDPRTADRGPYTEFCGFMVVHHGHIKLA